MREFIDVHFSSLLGVALLILGVILCVKDGSPNAHDLGEKLLACGLLAVNISRDGTGSNRPR